MQNKIKVTYANQYVNKDSEKYIKRSNNKLKVGETGKKDAAHILSYELLNVFETRTGGRPIEDKSQKHLHKAMNHDSNIRIKSCQGNRVNDRENDGKIAKAFVEGSPIAKKEAIDRARIVYKSVNKLPGFEKYVKIMEEIKVYNKETGRSHKLKNHHKFV